MRIFALLLVLLLPSFAPADTRTKNVILVTIDGLRWQEVFSGADQRLLNREIGGVRELETIRQRYWDDSPEVRRQRLMPFFWGTVAERGQVFGNVEKGSVARVTNGRFFSYPGYNELLSGFADPSIDSNAKKANPNTTVLEWLNRRPGFEESVAAFTSWDVFPYIINRERSGVYVNSGWEELDVFGDDSVLRQWNLLGRELPRYWSGVRYDIFTFRGAQEYLQQRQPRVLYVSLGETDDWAHDGRYGLYLDAAERSDRYIQQLWETAQRLDAYRGSTTLIVTTDHGRGEIRDGWKSHGTSFPGSDQIWIAVLGPDTPSLGVQQGGEVTQAQIAATVAAAVGEDFTVTDKRVAKPLPNVLENK